MTEIQKLVKELNEHNINYYVNNAPTISDREFDMKLKRLEQLEQQFPDEVMDTSPTQRVGNDLINGFNKISRTIPMLSLQNTYTIKEVTDFVNKVKTKFPKAKFTTELKFDGVSVSIKYKSGKLVEASTRGNGVIGDDITNNVKAIRNVPLQLIGNYPNELEIRGEVLMSFDAFNDINARRALEGKDMFSNPRNAVSGTIKSLSPKKVADRNLQCYFYFVEKGMDDIDSHWKRLKKLKSFGLPIHDYEEQFDTDSEILTFINQMDTNRFTLNIPIDGIVIKVDSYGMHDSIGTTSKYPKWAIAYKYDAEEATTQLISVVHQVGKTGIITPVAFFNPVVLGNVSINKATLHNYDFIASLDLHYKDMIVISRGGEVIPKVNRAYRSLSSSVSRVSPPTQCPVCGGIVKHKLGEVGYYCINPDCLGKKIGLFEHFVKPDAMNIKGIGESIVFALASGTKLKTVADLYKLTVSDLAILNTSGTVIGLKRANNIIDEIEKSKQVPFHRVLYALSIPNVGRTASKLLVAKFGSVGNILKASRNDVVDIDGIGPTIYSSLLGWRRDPKNLQLISDLASAGLQFSETARVSESNRLQGNIYVITGTFINISRKELVTKLEQLGAKVSGSVSKKTTAVIVGLNPGSKKSKAESLGIKLISEDEILKLIK